MNVDLESCGGGFRMRVELRWADGSRTEAEVPGPLPRRIRVLAQRVLLGEPPGEPRPARLGVRARVGTFDLRPDERAHVELPRV